MNADVSRHDAWQHDAPPAPVPRVEELRLLVADAADRAAMMLAGDYPAVEADDLLVDDSLVSLIDAVRILATARGASHIPQAARLHRPTGGGAAAPGARVPARRPRRGIRHSRAIHRTT